MIAYLVLSGLLLAINIAAAIIFILEGKGLAMAALNLTATGLLLFAVGLVLGKAMS